MTPTVIILSSNYKMQPKKLGNKYKKFKLRNTTFMVSKTRADEKRRVPTCMWPDDFFFWSQSHNLRDGTQLPDVEEIIHTVTKRCQRWNFTRFVFFWSSNLVIDFGTVFEHQTWCKPHQGVFWAKKEWRKNICFPK